MRILSDFFDYYDIWASKDGPVLERIAKNTGPNKQEQFRILEEAGFLTPPHGRVGDILESWWDAENQRVKFAVVYLDEMAHCGEGKEVWDKTKVTSNPHMGMPGSDRYYKEKELYCSAFVGQYPELGRSQMAYSLRRLQIGKHVFWIEYFSKTSWMSNVGDGDIQVVGVDMNAGYHPIIRRPLWAVDFVISNELYAIDLNIAPGIRGSGVEKYLGGPDACRELEKALEDLV